MSNYVDELRKILSRVDGTWDNIYTVAGEVLDKVDEALKGVDNLFPKSDPPVDKPKEKTKREKMNWLAENISGYAYLKNTPTASYLDDTINTQYNKHGGV